MLTFIKAGAGGPQMVALITGWAILGFHRVIAWEWPVLGGRFIAIRLLASVLLPVLAGVLAHGCCRCSRTPFPDPERAARNTASRCPGAALPRPAVRGSGR